MIRFFGLFVLFIPCVAMDVCKKKLPVLYMLLFSILAVLCNVIFHWAGLLEMGLGAVLGLLFMGFSALTKGSIGMGDGLMIAAMGLWCGIFSASAMTLLGFLFAAVFGLLYILFTKKSLKSTLPFAPFLAVASLCISGISWIGGSVG